MALWISLWQSRYFAPKLQYTQFTSGQFDKSQHIEKQTMIVKVYNEAGVLSRKASMVHIVAKSPIKPTVNASMPYVLEEIGNGYYAAVFSMIPSNSMAQVDFLIAPPADNQGLLDDKDAGLSLDSVFSEDGPITESRKREIWPKPR